LAFYSTLLADFWICLTHATKGLLPPLWGKQPTNMKKTFLAPLVVLSLLTVSATCQDIDSLVDVGGYRLHFHIIKGKGTPFLFDAGGGNDGTIWNKILKPIAAITGTTLKVENLSPAIFAEASPNREGILAYESSHYIFLSNPELVIDVIVRQYASISDKTVRNEVIERGFEHVFKSVNEMKKQEAKCRHSEDDLNSWAYSLLRQGEKKKALEVFKLNTLLHPESANVYDSEAEAYEAMGDTATAIKDYQRSLELNPGNKNAKEHLKKLGVAPGNGM
jgi:hypothetical protein